MPLFFERILLPSGWARNTRIRVEDGLITAIESDSAPDRGDEHHAIGLPGVSNLHSHAFQRGMAGLAEVRGPTSDSFWTWREVMYRFLDRLTPDDVEALSAQAYVEMLEEGFTRVGEFHYLHHDPAGAPYATIAEMAHRVIAAATATGINLTLLPSYYAFGSFGEAPPNKGQRRFICDLPLFEKLFDGSRAAMKGIPGGNIGVAPHSLRAVSPERLDAVIRMADGGPIHIHVAEQTKEVEDCLAWSGARPVEWLLDHQPVDRRWCLIHATHMTEEETLAVARSGAVAGLCPMTEASLGDGVFNAERFATAGGAYGVGTDSNICISLREELRGLEYAQRLAHRSRNILSLTEGRSTGRALFEAALVGGHQALGVELAGLRVGASADLLSLAPDHPALLGREGDNLLDGLIFATRENAVDSVWSRGRKVVAGGRHEAREKIAARFGATLQRLLHG